MSRRLLSHGCDGHLGRLVYELGLLDGLGSLQDGLLLPTDGVDIQAQQELTYYVGGEVVSDPDRVLTRQSSTSPEAAWCVSALLGRAGSRRRWSSTA